MQPKRELRSTVELALGRYCTVFTSTAAETKLCLESRPYELYVLDYWVPGSSGIHLSREIRRSDPHVPICFYTASGSEEQRERAFRAGANAYICETAGPEALAEEIDVLLQQFRETLSRQAAAGVSAQHL